MVKPPKRPRNAAATREAILQSALVAFSRAGYDGVGLREIAQQAGVTAILVNRYFGSKDALFAAVVEVAFADTRLLGGDIATLSERLAHRLAAKDSKEVGPVDPFRLMLRSAPNEQAAPILRKCIEKHFERPLAESLSGEEIRMRATLFLAIIAGFQLMRRIIGSTALVEANQAALSDRLASLFGLLVGENHSPNERTPAPPSHPLPSHQNRRRDAMRTRFKVGDHVTWNSEAGRVSGTIIKTHSKDVDYKGHTHHATPDEPQYEIKSDKTDHIAMHKGSALKKLAK